MGESTFTASWHFDSCQIKYAVSEYDYSGGVSDADADGLPRAVERFATEAGTWVYVNDPPLARLIRALFTDLCRSQTGCDEIVPYRA